MPSMTAVATRASALRARRALDLPRAADVVGERLERVERGLRHVGVALDVVVEGRGQVADRGEAQAHAPVEPWAAAEAADDGDADRLGDRRPCDRSGIGEVE